MPREGVPYPERLLCSVRCELKNIWTVLSGKLHSVNGVEGDGAGNVNIVSGDAAVVVTTDPSLNQIEVSLDQSQLPAAAVTSVNGETGAVVLDASEIPYNDPDGYTDDVDEKLNALTGVQNSFQLSLNQERTRAMNAESGLQTNINGVTASLPTVADAAVTNSPVVQQLVYADQNENIKINNINQYAVGLTGNDAVAGNKLFYNPLTSTSFKSATVKINSAQYWVIGKIKNLSNVRYYGLTGIASRNGIATLFGLSGQLYQGAYTCNLTALSLINITSPQVYIGVGTYNSEAVIIIRTTRQVTPSVMFLSSVGSSGDYPDYIEYISPINITVPSDYAEGGAIL